MPISTIREVNEALALIGLKPAQNTLQNVSKVCRDFFLKKLEAAVAEPSNTAMQKNLTDFLRCFSPAAKDILEKAGFSPTLQQIAVVAQKEPDLLALSIKFALSDDEVNSGQAIKYLTEIFGKAGKSAKRVGTASDKTTADFVQPELTRLPTQEKKPPKPTQSTQAEPSRPAADKPAPVAASAAARPAPERPPSVRTSPSLSSQAKGANQVSNTSTDKSYESCHVYGSSYALCFNASEWDGKAGIMVDAAVCNSPKTYDWQNAVHLWLNANELGGILAVLRRYIPSIEFSAHGSRKEKSFSITRQEGCYYVKVICKGLTQHAIRGVKLMPNQVPELTILITKMLLAAYPGIPAEQVLATIEAAYKA